MKIENNIISEATWEGEIIENQYLDAATINIQQNIQSADYTTVLADSGFDIVHPSTDENIRTFTIDSQANAGYELGTVIGFINMTVNSLSIAITDDTMYLAGTSSTGTRTLATNGEAVAKLSETGVWLISGVGLT